ncbi:Hypothetical protein NocV09_03700390 [Nannochloropsis oceanica]
MEEGEPEAQRAGLKAARALVVLGREGGKEEGCEVVYNVRSLCEYLVATGQFVEPTSRRAIEGEDVQALANKLVLLGESEMKDNLWAAFASPDRAALLRERMDLLEGLDRCVGEVVTEMLRVVEGGMTAAVSAADGEVRLCMLLPHFEHFFNQLVQADEIYALQCIDQYIRVLNGPPTYPTSDARGLLSACLSFLRDKERDLARKVERKRRKQQKQQHEQQQQPERRGWMGRWLG